MTLRRSKPYVRKSQRQRQQQLAEIRRIVLIVLTMTALIATGYFISEHFVHGKSRLSQPEETVFVKQKKTLPPPSPLSEEARLKRKLDNRLRDKLRQRLLKERNGEQDVVDDQFYAFYDVLPQMEVKVDARPLSPKMKHPKVLVVGNYSSRRKALNARYRWARRSGVPLRVVPVRERGRLLYRVQTAVLTDKVTYLRYRGLLQQAGAKPYPVWVSLKRPRQAPKKIRR